MSILDAYGDFDVPEEKSVVEVVEDPVKVIISCYDLFKKIIGGKTKKNNWYRNEPGIEPVYLQGLNVFVEKAELKPDAGQLEEIIKELRKRAKNFDGTGLFLSAMLNTTKINMLFVDEFPELDLIGYKIGKNKAVILGPKNNSFEIGGSAKEGSVTINQGTTDFQGCEAEGGNHINQGTIHYDQGLGATGGNHINIKTVRECKGERVIDLSQKQHPLKSQLEQKLDELKFLEQIKKTTPEETAKKMNEYDWQKFDKEINEICGEIKKVY